VKLVFISADVPDEISSKVIPFLKKNDVSFTVYYNNFDKPEEIIDYFNKNWGGALPATYIYNKIPVSSLKASTEIRAYEISKMQSKKIF